MSPHTHFFLVLQRGPGIYLTLFQFAIVKFVQWPKSSSLAKMRLKILFFLFFETGLDFCNLSF